MQKASAICFTQGVKPCLLLAVFHVIHNKQRLVKKYLLRLKLANAMFFNAFSCVTSVPFKACYLRPVNHFRILPSYTSGASISNASKAVLSPSAGTARGVVRPKPWRYAESHQAIDIPNMIYTILGMRNVYEHRKVPKQLGKIPKDILQRYEKWKDIVRLSGPDGLKAIRGFNDEALRGDWKGFRSSQLNQQYRVIYRIERDNILIKVVEVTPHDYRRK